MPELDEPDKEQGLLAGLLEKWHIPGAHELIEGRRGVAKRHPFFGLVQEQLQDIGRRIPKFERSSHEHELNRPDFFYKALFWSGINYILENLGELIDDAEESTERAAVSTGLNYGFLFRRRRYSNLDVSKLRLYHHERQLLGYSEGPGLYSYFYPTDVDMDLTDRLALSMARQQQNQIRRELSHTGRETDSVTKASETGNSSIKQGSISSPKSRSGSQGEMQPIEDEEVRDSEDSEREKNEDSDGERDIHLVVDSILVLTENIVRYGKQCDQLKERSFRRGKDGNSDQDEVITDLAFELFSAVARLTMSIKQWHNRDKMDADIPERLLARTVRLLRTVRLPRITELAAEAGREPPNHFWKEMVAVPDRSRDQMYEQIRLVVRDAVRDEMLCQREQGWSKYLWRSQ